MKILFSECLFVCEMNDSFVEKELLNESKFLIRYRKKKNLPISNIMVYSNTSIFETKPCQGAKPTIRVDFNYSIIAATDNECGTTL